MDPESRKLFGWRFTSNPIRYFSMRKKGRVAADRRGVFVIGVLGVLLTAKKAGILGSIRGDLDRLRQTSFHVSSRLYREILVRAGEL